VEFFLSGSDSSKAWRNGFTVGEPGSHAIYDFHYSNSTSCSSFSAERYCRTATNNHD